MSAILFGLFVIIQALDVASTSAALERGAEEANLLPAWLFGRFGFWPSCLAIKLAAVAVALAVTVLSIDAWVFTGILDAAGVAVLINNWRVLRTLNR